MGCCSSVAFAGRRAALPSDRSTWTKAMVAAADGDLAKLRLLQQSGVALHADHNADGWTPVMVAAFHGHVAVLQLITSEAKDPREQTQMWRMRAGAQQLTATMLAAQNGHAACLAWAARNGGRMTLSRRLSRTGGEETVVNCIMDEDRDGWTPVIYAAAYDQIEALQYALANGGALTLQTCAAKDVECSPEVATMLTPRAPPLKRGSESSTEPNASLPTSPAAPPPPTSPTFSSKSESHLPHRVDN